MVVYDQYPDSWARATTLRESALILFSVALGAIFLPDISGSLWTLSKDDVRHLIPESKVRSLQRTLVEGQVDDQHLADCAIESALLPLIRASHHPSSVYVNLRYSVDIHIDQEFSIGTKNYRVHRAEAQIGAKRVLPAGQLYYWVSVVRRAELLRGEFAEPGCLNREVVDVDPDISDDDWHKTVASLTNARMVVDGMSLEGAPSPPGLGTEPPHPPGVFRWYFPAPEMTSEADLRRTVVVSQDFPLVESRFPVVFGSYYVIGSTQIQVRIYSHDDVVVKLDPFLGRALHTGEIATARVAKPGLGTEINVTSSEDTLIWPGSGLAISWRCDNES
ncbi:hypothetical protein [Aeromicrobium sp. UC242_57]|uniref:hypothetical protein n=1 Tax=Aeromicrobium sp. UC242_57 TaxID=3374624 RepID=UPI00378EBBB4